MRLISAYSLWLRPPCLQGVDPYGSYEWKTSFTTQEKELTIRKAHLSHRGTKRLVSVNSCTVEGNSADICVSKVSPEIFVIKVTLIPIIFRGIKLPFWVRKKLSYHFRNWQISVAKFVE